MLFRTRKIINFIVLSFFIFGLYPSHAKSLNISKNTSHVSELPKEIGKVVERYSGLDNRKIYVIHDLHCNKAVQKNIHNILGHIRMSQKMKRILVGLEGNTGDLKTTLLNSISKGAEKDRIMDILLAGGYISGVESYSAYEPRTISLYGVENKSTYLRNFRLLYDSLDDRFFIKRFMGTMQKMIINPGKKRFYTKELNTIEWLQSRYKNSRISLAEYIANVKDIVPGHILQLQQFPNISLFLRIANIERLIDMNRLNREYGLIIKHLSDYINSEEYDELARIRKSQNKNYYHYVNSLLEKYSVRINSDFPMAREYQKLLNAQEHLDYSKLYNEIDEFTYKVKEYLANTSEAKDIVYLDYYMDIFEKYLCNKVSSRQLVLWEKEKAMVFTKMHDIAEKFAYVEYHMDSIHNIEKRMRAFYKLAINRNEIIVRNMLDKMRITNNQFSVLIIGGFHSEGISKILRSKGVGYEIIMPSLDGASDSSGIYIKRLKEQAVLMGLITPNFKNLTPQSMGNSLAVSMMPDTVLSAKIISALVTGEIKRNFFREYIKNKIEKQIWILRHFSFAVRKMLSFSESLGFPDKSLEEMYKEENIEGKKLAWEKARDFMSQEVVDIEDLGGMLGSMFRRGSTRDQSSFSVKDFLKNNTCLAVGCTEVALVIYLGASARFVANASNADIKQLDSKEKLSSFFNGVEGIHKKIKKIKLIASSEIIKEGLNAAIPGTKEFGIDAAVRKGLLCEPGGLEAAKYPMVTSLDFNFKIDIEEIDQKGVFAELELTTEDDHVVIVTISGKHNHISQIKKDGRIIYREPVRGASISTSEQNTQTSFTLDDAVQMCKSGLSDDEINELFNGLLVNLRAAVAGLTGEWGVGVSRTMLKNAIRYFKPKEKEEIIKNPILLLTKYRGKIRLKRLIQIFTAAASDARMGGWPEQVLASSGSGNQGIIATMPILVSACYKFPEIFTENFFNNFFNNMGESGQKFDIKFEEFSDEQNRGLKHVARAVLLSHLVLNLAAQKLGLVGSLCGCVMKTSFGAAAGLIYLEHLDIKLMIELQKKIQSAAAHIAKCVTICDGAKPECAEKVLYGATLAFEAASSREEGVLLRCEYSLFDKTLYLLKEFMHIIPSKKILEYMLKKRDILNFVKQSPELQKAA